MKTLLCIILTLGGTVQLGAIQDSNNYDVKVVECNEQPDHMHALYAKE